jgi:mannose-6-phosphate isomerase-like protein (cupin superfamily)
MSRRDNTSRDNTGSDTGEGETMTSDEAAEAVLGRAGESPAYWYRGALWNVLMSADQTLGEFTLLDQVIPAGAGPPAHVHERQAEGFYVLSGELELVVGANDETVRAGPGSAVWVPKSTRHAFRVVSDEDARLLNFYAPGGFDDHLPYYGVEATAQTLPPAELGVPVLDRERMATSQEMREAYLQRLADIAEGTWDFSVGA